MSTIDPFVNQVIHGDCVTVLRSFPDASVDLIVTDPPYLVNYTPRDGRRCHNDNARAWLKPSFTELARVLKPNRFCVSFYGWPWIDEFMTAWKQAGFRPVSHLTWVKSHCSREGYTNSHHEVGFLLAKGKPPRPSSPIRDVLPWSYTGNHYHTNEKPLVGIKPLIEAFSHPNDIVLDPFAGSGTTGIAARDCGRRFILIEKSAYHCETVRIRLTKVPLKVKMAYSLAVRWQLKPEARLVHGGEPTKEDHGTA